jgi:peptide methionine sulfoxide reductase MsrB|tara:strand:- start:26 stop:592 length:567 start_codon:yes stop_codon:yes gene_type:complete
VGGAVGGIIAINHNGKLEQGNAAPAAIKGKASTLMVARKHGTCVDSVQNPLRWNADVETGDRISCFNRHYAERAGSWLTTDFIANEQGRQEPIIFYDSVTSKPLFQAPVGRSWDQFIQESTEHGWPSFRDQEVITDDTRVLEDGEVVSMDGTHLGHNLPDGKGNRYCINLVCVAGQPPKAGVVEGGEE